jgi:hypothetical protein
MPRLKEFKVGASLSTIREADSFYHAFPLLGLLRFNQRSLRLYGLLKRTLSHESPFEMLVIRKRRVRSSPASGRIYFGDS